MWAVIVLDPTMVESTHTYTAKSTTRPPWSTRHMHMNGKEHDHGQAAMFPIMWHNQAVTVHTEWVYKRTIRMDGVKQTVDGRR